MNTDNFFCRFDISKYTSEDFRLKKNMSISFLNNEEYLHIVKNLFC